MDLIYNIGIGSYKLAAQLASLTNKKARRMLNGQSRTFKYLKKTLNGEKGYIWIHASSLGEFEQGRPLIEMLKEQHPNEKILLTFFSPSGYEVRKNYNKVDAVCYLPFDLPLNVKRFLDLVQPKMAIFIKYEFWGNYLMSLKRREIPTYIISAIFRSGQAFFKPWGGMFRKMLRCFTTLYVQNEESRKLLASIDVNNVVVAGDTRFDRVAQVKAAAREFSEVEAFVKGAEFVLVGGSTWEPDEDLIIPYFNGHPEMKLIIAPHEFDKKRLTMMMSKINRPAVFYSQLTQDNNLPSSFDCVIIDCFGLLSSLYRYGTMAMVGGGFGNGIHNINEAAVYGIPVLFGPKHEKFAEAEALIECGGGFEVNNSTEFKSTMDELIGNTNRLTESGNAAGAYIAENTGATSTIYRQIQAELR